MTVTLLDVIVNCIALIGGLWLGNTQPWRVCVFVVFAYLLGAFYGINLK